MLNANANSNNNKIEKSDLPTDGCELNLSADNQWLRLIVSGKQVTVFHVNYVNKVLGNTKDATKAKTSIRKSELPPSI